MNDCYSMEKTIAESSLSAIGLFFAINGIISPLPLLPEIPLWVCWSVYIISATVFISCPLDFGIQLLLDSQEQQQKHIDNGGKVLLDLMDSGTDFDPFTMAQNLIATECENSIDAGLEYYNIRLNKTRGTEDFDREYERYLVFHKGLRAADYQEGGRYAKLIGRWHDFNEHLEKLHRNPSEWD